MLGTTAATTVCQHHSIPPLRTVIVTESRHALQSSRSAEAHRRCIRCSAAVAGSVAAANIVDQPADNGVSMHPDAVRRREEAEARYFDLKASVCRIRVTP